VATEQDYCCSICLGRYAGNHNTLNQSLTTINLLPCPLSQVQKVVILSTCCITRKFLSNEVHYTVKRLTTHSHESSLRSQLYTLISTHPDTTTCTTCTHQHQTQPHISHFLVLTADYTHYKTNSNSKKLSTIEHILKLLHKCYTENAHHSKILDKTSILGEGKTAEGKKTYTLTQSSEGANKIT